MKNPVSCDQCRAHFASFLDFNLDESDVSTSINDVTNSTANASWRAHLKNCAACRNEYSMLRDVVAQTRTLPHFAAPPDLRQRVRAQIEAETQSQQSRTRAPKSIFTLKTPRFSFPHFSLPRWATVSLSGALAAACLLLLVTQHPQNFAPTSESSSPDSHALSQPSASGKAVSKSPSRAANPDKKTARQRSNLKPAAPAPTLPAIETTRGAQTFPNGAVSPVPAPPFSGEASSGEASSAPSHLAPLDENSNSSLRESAPPRFARLEWLPANAPKNAAPQAVATQNSSAQNASVPRAQTLAAPVTSATQAPGGIASTGAVAAPDSALHRNAISPNAAARTETASSQTAPPASELRAGAASSSAASAMSKAADNAADDATSRAPETASSAANRADATSSAASNGASDGKTRNSRVADSVAKSASADDAARNSSPSSTRSTSRSGDEISAQKAAKNTQTHAAKSAKSRETSHRGAENDARDEENLAAPRRDIARARNREAEKQAAALTTSAQASAHQRIARLTISPPRNVTRARLQLRWLDEISSSEKTVWSGAAKRFQPIQIELKTSFGNKRARAQVSLQKADANGVWTTVETTVLSLDAP